MAYYREMLDTKPEYAEKLIILMQVECTFSEDIKSYLDKILDLEKLHIKLQQLSASELAQSGKGIIDQMILTVLGKEEMLGITKGYLEEIEAEVTGKSI